MSEQFDTIVQDVNSHFQSQNPKGKSQGRRMQVKDRKKSKKVRGGGEGGDDSGDWDDEEYDSEEENEESDDSDGTVDGGDPRSNNPRKPNPGNLGFDIEEICGNLEDKYNRKD